MNKYGFCLDIKKDNIYKIIWQLSYPLIILTFIQKIAGIFEGTIVSLNSTTDLAVLSLCSPFISLITIVGYGIGIGFSATVGKIAGEGEWPRRSESVTKCMLVVQLILGSLFALFIFVLMPIALGKDVPSEILRNSRTYMLPYLIGSPLIFMYSSIMAALRGMGLMRSGIIITVIAAPVQIFISYVMYSNFGIGTLGLGMVISRIIGCVVGFMFYKKTLSPTMPTDRHDAKFFREVSLDIMRISVPASLSKSVQPLANIFLNNLMLIYGSAVVSAKGLGSRMEPFFYLPAMAISTAAITVISQCKGKRDINLMNTVISKLRVSCIIPTLILFIPAFIWTEQLWMLLTPDTLLQQAGVIYTRIFGSSYVFAAIEMVNTSVLNGLGTSVPMLLITIIRLAVTLILSFISVHFGMNVNFIWWSFFTGNLTSFAISTCIIKHYTLRLKTEV